MNTADVHIQVKSRLDEKHPVADNSLYEQHPTYRPSQEPAHKLT